MNPEDIHDEEGLEAWLQTQTREALVAGMIQHGHRHAREVLSEDDLERLVREQARPGDMVVCLGAGTISTWAHGLPERLKKAEKV